MADLPRDLVLLAVLAAVAIVVGGGLRYRARTRRAFVSDIDRATYTALHTMALASPHLRDGLSAGSAAAAAPHLRALLDTSALALTDVHGVALGWDGEPNHHMEWLATSAFEVADSGRQQVLDQREMNCGRDGCPVRAVIVS
nr:sensor histidine kinase [Actinomycetota bacterium]